MNDICYFCGKNRAETKDHIFPKNLFPRPLPSNLPTVPCCQGCNHSFSDDEEIFRTFVASGRAYETPSGRRIWDERVRPSLEQNRRGFKTLLRQLARELKSPSGVIYSVALQIDQKRVNSVLSKIAKGLYYLDTGEPLADYVELQFKYGGDKPQKLIQPHFDKAKQGAKRTDLGQGVVTYWRNVIKDDPSNSMTWLLFFDVHAFLVLTVNERTLAKTK